MKPTLRHQQGNCLLTVARVRAAQLFRVLREYYPDAGLTLAACVGVAKWRRREDACLTGDQPRNILVIRLDAMGDLIMATPIFRQLKQAYPTASITALVPKASSELLETNPFVDRIITAPPMKRFLLLQGARRDISTVRLYWKFLRGEHFDLALQPRLGPDYFRANLLLTLVHASIRVKFEDVRRPGPSKYLAMVAYRSITKLPRPALQHEVLNGRAFVNRLTDRIFDCKPEVFLSSADRTYSKSFYDRVDSGSTIVCVAFGAQAKRRKWPLERWVEAVCLLAQSRNVEVVVLCSRAETWEGERLRLRLNSVAGINSWIVSGARLREVAACIEGCDLLLCTDSGVAHLAATVGCAVLVVSPHPVNGDLHHENSPLRFKPYSDRARVLQPETGRYPCQSGCDAVEPHCILNLTPSRVARVAEEMLLASRSDFHLAFQGRPSAKRKHSSSSRALDTPFLQASKRDEVAVNFPAAIHQEHAID